MDGYEYFNVDNTSDSALIIINGSKYEDKGMKLDGNGIFQLISYQKIST